MLLNNCQVESVAGEMFKTNAQSERLQIQTPRMRRWAGFPSTSSVAVVETRSSVAIYNSQPVAALKALDPI